MKEDHFEVKHPRTGEVLQTIRPLEVVIVPVEDESHQALWVPEVGVFCPVEYVGGEWVLRCDIELPVSLTRAVPVQKVLRSAPRFISALHEGGFSGLLRDSEASDEDSESVQRILDLSS